MYEELTYQEAKGKAQKALHDGYGEALILKDEHGHWALYYFYGYQEPPPHARPHWLEGPKEEPDFRAPFAMKLWLEEHGYEDFQNDVD